MTTDRRTLTGWQRRWRRERRARHRRSALAAVVALLAPALLAAPPAAAAPEGPDATGNFSSSFVYTERAPSSGASGAERWEAEGSLGGNFANGNVSCCSSTFSMEAHSPSAQASVASGAVDEFDLPGFGPTTLHWGSYTRAGDAVHVTVVATLDWYGDDPVTIELDGNLGQTWFVPTTLFTECASSAPCSLRGTYTWHDGEHDPTVPEGLAGGNGGSPSPDTPPPAPSWSATEIESHTGSAAASEVRWQSRQGRSRWCGPAGDGDGWSCVGPDKHGIRWTGYARAVSPNNVEYWDADLYQGSISNWRAKASVWCDVANGGTTKTWCSYPSNTYNPLTSWPPPVSVWKLYETYTGTGWHYLDYQYDYKNSSGTLLQYSSGMIAATAFPSAVDTTGNTNVPPLVELGTPSIGRTIHRDRPGDVDLAFTYTATDSNGHNWTGDLRLYEPGVAPCSDVATLDCHIHRDTLSGAKQASNKTARTPAVVLPRENGTYTWRVRATDTSGTTTAVGSWVTGTFDFVWNLAPEVPTLVSPAGGDPDDPPEVPEGDPVTFVIETADPENDPYRGEVLWRRVSSSLPPASLETTTSASGAHAVAQVTETLPPGLYEWRARARDTVDPNVDIGFSDWQRFEVVRTVSNQAPGAPALVAPADGHAFPHGSGQVFTLNAADPEGDTVLGVVTATNLGTGQETTFATEPVASGTDSSGSPPVPLAPGSYRWSAVAVDGRGASSDPSAARMFSVAAGPTNEAPATTLVAPGVGHQFERNDPQVFTVAAVDPEGDAYTAEVRVNGQVRCTTPLTPSGDEASCAPVPPLGAGAYQWDARATDVHGNEGTWAAPARTFTVAANHPPGPPTPEEPPDGHVFRSGEPQLFAVNATDPDGDPYHARVVVKQGTTTVAEFDTAESPSGTDSFGTPTSALSPGAYTWVAQAIDVAGNESAFFSPPRTFTVNRPPDVPSLVAPPVDHEFAQGADQVFSLSAADPDDHPYHADITVHREGTGMLLTFRTSQAASGEAASGSPPVRLPPGVYTWSVTATDSHGGTSGASAARRFSVAGSLDNQPPGAPTLVTPVNGASFPFGEPDRFVVRATDANQDPYTATATVRTTAGTVVATFETSPAASGMETSGRPPDLLPVGSYTWSATATDLRGTTGPVSETWSFTVVPADP